jgi:dTDP-4-amino-4,6-dideoxygalactose transaminase
VDFVDIDPDTYNMSVDALARKLRQARASDRLPKVVMPVHLAGQSCEMRPIRALADEYGFKIVEDASHAIGADYGERPVGACTYSDIAVFSFHPVKIVTTCEGGVAVTADGRLARRMGALRTHGVTRDPAEMSGDSDGPWYYQQIDLGYNYRLTDVHAALGASQMRRLAAYVARRRQIAARYDGLLSAKGVKLPWQHPETRSSWHIYIVRLPQEDIRLPRRQVFEAMRAAGIGVNVHYIPVHLQPYYRRRGFGPGMFPEAERYYREAITLPVFPLLSDGEQERVVDTLLRAIA